MPNAVASPGTLADDDTSGTETWSDPTNAAASDDSYATNSRSGTSVQTHRLKATNFGFSIPTGATIEGIEVSVERKADRNSPTGS